MCFDDRCAIIRELECVDEVIGFKDDDSTAQTAIKRVLQSKPLGRKVVFANGGDRTDSTTPEYSKFKGYQDVEFAFAVGGEDKKIAAVGFFRNGVSFLRNVIGVNTEYWNGVWAGKLNSSN